MVYGAKANLSEVTDLVQVKNLIQKHKDNVILNDISLCVEKNKLYGIIGDKDSGKSTLMEVLSGVLIPSCGSVKIGGFDIFEDPVQAKSLIGYMPEKMSFYDDMTVSEYLTFIAHAKKISRAETNSRIEYALSKTGISCAKNIVISRLNGNARARLGLAQAILNDPEVLLLDGPTCGLSESESAEIFKLVKTLSQKRTLVICSRDISISSFCDEVVTLSFGQLNYDYHKSIKEDA